MNAIALFVTQGCTGAMVEYLLPNLRVKGSPPACGQLFFRYSAGKFRWRRKLNRKFRPTCHNFFCYIYELSQRHPVWVAEINLTACNSAACLETGGGMRQLWLVLDAAKVMPYRPVQLRARS
jgi:hypothetical protein